jgi:hypothetical protein
MFPERKVAVLRGIQETGPVSCGGKEIEFPLVVAPSITQASGFLLVAAS